MRFENNGRLWKHSDDFERTRKAMPTYFEALKEKEMLEKWVLVFLIVGCTSLIFVVCFPIDFCLYRRRKRQARERKKEAMFKSQMVKRTGQTHANVSKSQIIDYYALEDDVKPKTPSAPRKTNGFARIVNMFRKKRQEEMLLHMQNVPEKLNAHSEKPTVSLSSYETEYLRFPKSEQVTETTQTEYVTSDAEVESSSSDESGDELDQTISERVNPYKESDDLVCPDGKYTSYGAIQVSNESSKQDVGSTNEAFADQFDEKRAALFPRSNAAVELTRNTSEERLKNGFEKSVIVEVENSEEDSGEDLSINHNVINVKADLNDAANEQSKNISEEDNAKLDTSVVVDITGLQRKERTNIKQFLQPPTENNTIYTTRYVKHNELDKGTYQTAHKSISDNCLTIGVNQSKVATLSAATSLNSFPRHIQKHVRDERSLRNKRSGSTLSEADVGANGRWRKKKGHFLKKESSMPDLRPDQEDVDSDGIVSHEVWTTPAERE